MSGIKRTGLGRDRRGNRRNAGGKTYRFALRKDDRLKRFALHFKVSFAIEDVINPSPFNDIPIATTNDEATYSVSVPLPSFLPFTKLPS